MRAGDFRGERAPSLLDRRHRLALSATLDAPQWLAALRPAIEFDNVLNKTVFTFGAEFVNFNALRPDATPAQRQVFLDTFLVPTRTLRPRSLRVGLRLDF